MQRTISTQHLIDTTTLPTLVTVEEAIGNTPLLALRRVTADLPPAVRVLTKAEWLNPGGSIKDRAALNMIRTAEARGELTPDVTLIDATSGNTGIGYAMIGAALGYRITLVMPANASPERISILRAYGAELVLTDPQEGVDGAIRRVQEMVAAAPERYFYADQYSNPANWEAHYHTTGPEIWGQTRGQVTHFVAGLGTSGTMMGVGRFLRTVNPQVRLIALQPDGPLHGLEGLKHMQTAIVPPIYDRALVDEERPLRTEAAYEMAKRLAREEGLFVGISAAAAVAGALDVARELETGIVVTVLPDGGYKYLSQRFWNGE
jgi:S-sulfo-L-cysteine synthase (O-acetyl-L-serine-dependent)